LVKAGNNGSEDVLRPLTDHQGTVRAGVQASAALGIQAPAAARSKKENRLKATLQREEQSHQN
jgi:hypothetical protein